LNRENLDLLGATEIREDVAAIERVLGIELGPRDTDDFVHRNLTSTIFRRVRASARRETIQRDIVEAGMIRKSLG
jgi:hypothetical protein